MSIETGFMLAGVILLLAAVPLIMYVSANSGRRRMLHEAATELAKAQRAGGSDQVTCPRCGHKAEMVKERVYVSASITTKPFGLNFEDKLHCTNCDGGYSIY
jgi:DNA-directed RNA polymerase subunit RPC12/RpoP